MSRNYVVDIRFSASFGVACHGRAVDADQRVEEDMGLEETWMREEEEGEDPDQAAAVTRHHLAVVVHAQVFFLYILPWGQSSIFFSEFTRGDLCSSATFKTKAS